MDPKEEERAVAYDRAAGRCECTSVTCSHHRGRCCARLCYGEWQLIHLANDDPVQSGIAMCARCASKHSQT